MYVHIGGEACIPGKSIIAFLDLDTVTAGEDSSTRTFLVQMEDAGRVEPVLPEIPRSVVVTDDRVYLTPLSVQTLEKRFRDGIMNI